MSTVLQPRGPLPARVYWTRRLLALAVLVGVLGVIGMAVASGGDGGDADGADAAVATPDASTGTPTAREDGTDDPTTPPPRARDTGPGSKAGEARAGDRSDKPESGNGREGNAPEENAREDRGKPTVTPTAAPTPLPEPTGACDPAEVVLDISVEDSAKGEPNPVTLSFTSMTTPACTIGLTAETLEIQVTSGSDIVWSSTDCPARLAARQVIARLDPPATYTFTWPGRRSTQSCGGPGEVPDSGGYYVHAGLIGGEPVQAYFDVT
ncbi:MAG: hypothetical protein ACRDO2_13445 [Nocardioidaceae bacterium]